MVEIIVPSLFYLFVAGRCQVSARPQNVTTHGQVLIRTVVSPGCGPSDDVLIRYKGPQGGIIPPLGYLRLRGTYPNIDVRWLSPGWSVQRQSTVDSRVWIDLYKVPPTVD